MNAKSMAWASSLPSADAIRSRQLFEPLRLLTAAALRGEPGGLGQHQPPRLEQRGQRSGVEAAGAEEHVGDHVEAAVRAPVAHAHGVAVAHLDEPQLLEPLDGLAHRGHVHPQLGRERALGRQLLARRVAPRQQLLAEDAEDLVGDESALNGLGHRRPVYRCSEQSPI